MPYHHQLILISADAFVNVSNTQLRRANSTLNNLGSRHVLLFLLIFEILVHLIEH